MIDIIIPVLNEAKILTEKKQYYQSLRKAAHVIFVDGGSSDDTVRAAGTLGDVISSDPGRGMQKNRGVELARSNILLFMHVDTAVAAAALECIKACVDQGVDAGCLTMKIDDPKPIFRIYERVVNMRAKVFGAFDGDLGMFIRKDIFQELGGFERLPYMEDLVFSKKLNTSHNLAFLDEPISVSSRKWQEQGFLKTLINYSMAYVQLWTGKIGSKNNIYVCQGPSIPKIKNFQDTRNKRQTI